MVRDVGDLTPEQLMEGGRERDRATG